MTPEVHKEIVNRVDLIVDDRDNPATGQRINELCEFLRDHVAPALVWDDEADAFVSDLYMGRINPDWRQHGTIRDDLLAICLCRVVFVIQKIDFVYPDTDEGWKWFIANYQNIILNTRS